MHNIVVENVTKDWVGFRAVDNVSFSVNAGTLLTLLGPSGCGKSTTLRLIAGLEQPSSGRIAIAGRDVTDLPPAKRGIAMVFQSYALFPHLSVAENIMFGLKVRNAPRAERDARLAKASDMLGLKTLLERKPSQLSGGQQQRVALARAVVAEAAVCLMDEPLSNLDAQLRLDMRKEIRGLQQRLGMTMIYVTHDQVEAMTMSDRIILMRGGQIEQNGTPDDLYSRPATTFVASFIGTPPMNVISAKSISSYDFSRPPETMPHAGLSVGIRPEDVLIDPDGVPAEVIAAEYLGADTLIEARIMGERFVARTPGKAKVTAGDNIRLSWKPEQTHWFDTESRRRYETRSVT